MSTAQNEVDVVIIGAGAAGLMCAIEAAKRNRKVVILDHANKVGKKILMSGGGRCNFTNLYTHPDHFISHNVHFCKSALSRYTQYDFIDKVKRHQIPFHEKTKGQLFCDHKSSDIVEMLLAECAEHPVDILLNTKIEKITQTQAHHFVIKSNRGDYQCQSLVIATGGLSIPTMGASPFGYKVAEQFGIQVWPTRAGLVPLTLHPEDKEKLSLLSGVAVDSMASNERIQFRENTLFTHRGLSGPAILQISSYWQAGEFLTLNLLPEHDLYELLKTEQKQHAQKKLKNVLHDYLPKRVVEIILSEALGEKNLQSISHRDFESVAAQFNEFKIQPNGTEGYRTAEVTLGGIDCDAISSKTMEAHQVRNLYFIGEVLDVTGWLGGFNFQWAWSSGWAAGQYV